MVGIGYDAEPWHDLFVMMGGASAALAGLIFVAVSLNLDPILAYPKLPRLAARTLSLLVAELLLSALGLTPQPRPALGAEVLVGGLVLVGVVVGARAGSQQPNDPWFWEVGNLAVALLASLPALAGSVSLLAGRGGGLYWLLAELLLGTAAAAFWAWILLIEICR